MSRWSVTSLINESNTLGQFVYGRKWNFIEKTFDKMLKESEMKFIKVVGIKPPKNNHHTSPTQHNI